MLGVTVTPPADLTMIVPTYNERDRLRELTRSLFDAAAASRLHLELVIVDDNSPDGTGVVADELAATHRITVVHRAGKLGLGTAVVAGFGAQAARHIAIISPRMINLRRDCLFIIDLP